jgi:hypothetical protein
MSAFVLARLSICFIALHELAHHHFGHTQLLEIWRDAPTDAEKVMHSGFPSADARRAMESFADVWATETQYQVKPFLSVSVRWLPCLN